MFFSLSHGILLCEYSSCQDKIERNLEVIGGAGVRERWVNPFGIHASHLNVLMSRTGIRDANSASKRPNVE